MYAFSEVIPKQIYLFMVLAPNTEIYQIGLFITHFGDE